MAYTTLLFKHPETGDVKNAPAGFSWTTFFFGFFPAFFRGDWKWGLIMLVLLFLTAGLSGFVFMFIYNKMYIKGLIKKGYKVSSISPVDLNFVTAKMKMEIPLLESN